MPTTSGDLASLVCNLQNRTTDHLGSIDALFGRLGAIVHRLAPRDFASRGLTEDVVSHALELICRRPPGHFDPKRGSVEGYLSSIVRTAIRDVRDENQFTIGRRRDYQGQLTPAAERTVVEPSCELDSNVELVTELGRRLDGYPDLMIGAVAITFHGHTVVDAAAAAGVTRFQLLRQLARKLERDDIAA